MIEGNKHSRVESAADIVAALDEWLQGGTDAIIDQGDEEVQDVEYMGTGYVSQEELKSYCETALWLRLPIELEDGQKGTLEIENTVEHAKVTMPFVGISKSKEEVKGIIGWQVINFSREEFKQFLEFFFNTVPFSASHPFGKFAHFEITGVTREDSTDFLPSPRLQVDYVEMDYEDDGKIAEFSREIKYFPLENGTRESLKKHFDDEIASKKRLSGGGGQIGYPGLPPVVEKQQL